VIGDIGEIDGSGVIWGNLCISVSSVIGGNGVIRGIVVWLVVLIIIVVDGGGVIG